MMEQKTHTVHAQLRHDVVAQLGPARPLRFDDRRRSAGLPGHVRAGSAIRRWGQHLVVAQDDVNALAVLDGADGAIVPLALPPGADGGRIFSDALGNKALKLDLESCVTLPDGRLVALGSGSTSARERVIVVGVDRGVRSFDAGDLYRGLRERVDFSGSELNIEGTVLQGEALRLFQRGNGAVVNGRAPTNAIGDLGLVGFLSFLDDGGATPLLQSVLCVDLGHTRGVPYGFTDACALPDGRLAFLAGAEDSPDTYRDGEVVGARFGVLEGDRVWTATVCDEHGEPTRLKLEGIEFVNDIEDGWRFVAVTDMDSPDVASTLHELVVRVPQVARPQSESGSWPRAR